MNKYKSIILKINYIMLFTFFTFFLTKYIISANTYKISNVIITGNDYIENDSINKSIYNEIKDRNIFNINTKKIKKIINKNNYVYSNKISKKFPSTINIKITEVKPTALISIGDKLYFLNQDMDKIDADINAINHFNNYPIITNLTKNSIQTNRLKNILTKIINKSNTIYTKLNEIQFLNNEIILILDNNTKIIMSSENYENNLKKLFEFNNQVILKNNLILEKYNYINMKIPNQIIINEKQIRI